MNRAQSAASADAHTEDDPHYGALLREARAKAGMTRKSLAAASGASERYLAMLESGAGNPSLSLLGAIAQALDIALTELLPMGGERDAETARLVAAVRRLAPEGLAKLDGWLVRGHHIDPRRRARRVLLLGLRGAGKTTLGGMLAAKLGMPFIELSKRVEESYGGAIGLLIEINGQAALRQYERQAWEEICQGHEEAVIAAPGGIVADSSLYERMLATSHSVWLKAAPEDHMSRVMAQGDFRPVTGNRRAMDDLKAILAARSAEYARADVHVDTSQVTLSDSFERLHAAVGDLLNER